MNMNDLMNVIKMLNGRDPETVAREIARRRGMTEDDLNKLFNEASEQVNRLKQKGV